MYLMKTNPKFLDVKNAFLEVISYLPEEGTIINCCVSAMIFAI